MLISEKYDRQEIFRGWESYRKIGQIMENTAYHKALLVCGGTFKRSKMPAYFADKKIDYCMYDGFQPNPTYENILEALQIFRENQCDFLISVGGGSAIDVAKGVKAYANMDHSKQYIRQEITDSGICHLAIPTTAGTGSESTHFAVMYYEGKKMSVSHSCLLPEYVILEPELLATLPDYQKKVTLLDALCQATESYWSVKADEESRGFAKEAITKILRHAEPYIQEGRDLEEIFHGANLAGRAINLTQTTLAHAMSYQLSSLYGIAHGHAVALCLPYVWEFLASQNPLQEGCQREKIEQILMELNHLYGCKNTEESIALFRKIFVCFGLSVPKYSPEDLDVLTEAVNVQRMKNYPAAVNKIHLKDMYQKILTDQEMGEKS